MQLYTNLDLWPKFFAVQLVTQGCSSDGYYEYHLPIRVLFHAFGVSLEPRVLHSLLCKLESSFRSRNSYCISLSRFAASCSRGCSVSFGDRPANFLVIMLLDRFDVFEMHRL